MKPSILISLASSLPAAVAAPSADKHSQKKFDFATINKVVSFGDSWTDTRFNTSGVQPSISNPFGNTGKTSSNGKMWPMYLTTQYNQSSVLLYNMAVGGAVTDVNIVKTGPNDVVTQVNRFDAYLQQLGQNFFQPKHTLYTIFIGINDIYRTINDADQAETVIKIMDRLDQLTTDLHGHGARQFLFISTPPQSLFPNNVPKPIAPTLKAASENWNKKLHKLLKQLDRKLSHSTFFLFDIVPLITAVTEDPSQFPETAVYKSTGFCADYKSGTITPDFKSDNCEYNASEYLYIDGAHPTQAFHQILAKKVAEQLAAVRTIT
ncbi:anter-specific proline-rich APG [Fusarium mexicanum]|uniref:Anter-specific proline-rich APG n=1 Tax=Fusarium mexicanum TaxID=751941 RepID=A0A8H5J4Y1_9HYPO|nr:anter-specific proline-rich APG [Fusarium mexicanum]